MVLELYFFTLSTNLTKKKMMKNFPHSHHWSCFFSCRFNFVKIFVRKSFVMSSSMYKSDYCDPKKNHQLCQLLEEGESSINCVRQIAKAPSLCQRHKPSKRPSSGSEIDISLLRNNPIGFNVAADKKTSYFSITNPSCNSCEPCIESKSEYKLLSRPTTSFEGKVKKFN